jgi:ATP-dependent DNA helicase RecG
MVGRTLRELAGAPLDVLGLRSSLRVRLGRMGLHSVLDLLSHYPRRYHDRTRRAAIAALPVGEEATVVGEVRTVRARPTRTRRTLVEATVEDATGRVQLVFFNQPWRRRQLEPGTEVAVHGRCELFRGQRRLTNPAVDVVGRPGAARTGVIVPIYPQSGVAEVSSWEIQAAVARALEWAGTIAEVLPPPLRADLRVVDRPTAYRWVHRPEDLEQARQARRRLRFDEFLRMQVGLVARKRALAARVVGIAHPAPGPLSARWRAGLGFALTDDQETAIGEIAADLAAAAPMHRLLQGEVGSGKTMVAAAAIVLVVEGGRQVAVMAPTEVLAEQLHRVVRATLGGLEVDAPDTLTGRRPLEVALLTQRTGAPERRRIEAGLADGSVDVVVGTHALLYGEVPFRALGLVVIDEQHRFGVEQRALLRERARGPVPDVLVMTATPIPRTAAMLVYGDLDRSELRRVPPGRQPVTTVVVPPDPPAREEAYERLRAEVGAGRQAYVICPLVEGSERVEAKAVTAEFERLRAGPLAGLRLGLLHGQLPGEEKDRVMEAFRSGELDVLVATTVVEVGVDVPNATVMVIEDAERFGLSQLHQLRGRVGRGRHPAWCFLFADATTPTARARMDAMASSGDGFELAERDLEIRGAGEVFGERQAGIGDLKLGRLPRDVRYVEHARRTAERLLDGDPDLAAHRGLAEEVEDLLGDAVEFLFKS